MYNVRDRGWMFKWMPIHQKDNKWIVNSNFVTSCLVFRGSIPRLCSLYLTIIIFFIFFSLILTLLTSLYSFFSFGVVIFQILVHRGKTYNFFHSIFRHWFRDFNLRGCLIGRDPFFHQWLGKFFISYIFSLEFDLLVIKVCTSIQKLHYFSILILDYMCLILLFFKKYCMRLTFWFLIAWIDILIFFYICMWLMFYYYYYYYYYYFNSKIFYFLFFIFICAWDFGSYAYM